MHQTFQSKEHMLAAHAAERQAFSAGRRPMQDLVSNCASKMGVSVSDLRGPSKARKIANARFPIWAALHKMGYSLQQIGAYFGGRHHTSILYGIKKARIAAQEGKEQ